MNDKKLINFLQYDDIYNPTFSKKNNKTVCVLNVQRCK